MGFKCSIVGLPNVGKSTLFNALTSAAQAAVGNYPFCTVEPNVGRVPVPDEERDGNVGAAALYAHLRETGGISMPHSSATDQGTDWRDNDPELEPLMEIFQGYRGSYEYQGAPRAASDQKLLAQRSGYQPLGFWWRALERGYKLGVQASSDHWSTHISYACLIAPLSSRLAPGDSVSSPTTAR